jgi:hypothetical protein
MRRLAPPLSSIAATEFDGDGMRPWYKGEFRVGIAAIFCVLRRLISGSRVFYSAPGD